MAKRFIDTELFKDEWFSNLSNDAKVFWLYFITNCDHAGILKFNTKMVKLCCNISEVETVTQELGDRLVTVSKDLYWMPKFFSFQYPNYPEKKFKAADSAVLILEKYGIDLNTYLTLMKELPNSYGIGIGISNGISKSISIVKEEGHWKINSEIEIEKCLEIALKDERWVRRNNADSEQLQIFNEILEGQGIYHIEPIEYKRYFHNLKIKRPEKLKKEYTTEELKQMALEIDLKNKS